MSDDTFSLSKWWFSKRLQYNKGLLFTGLMGFVALAVTQTLKTNETHNVLLIAMQSAAVGLSIFLVLANIAFGIGYVIDSIFNNKNNQSFRDWLFFIGFGFAILTLVAFIVAFICIIN